MSYTGPRENEIQSLAQSLQGNRIRAIIHGMLEKKEIRDAAESKLKTEGVFNMQYTQTIKNSMKPIEIEIDIILRGTNLQDCEVESQILRYEYE